MIRIEWHPDERTLRQFGWFSLIGFPLIAWLPVRALGAPDAAVHAVSAVGPLLLIIGLIAPRLLRGPFIALSLIAMPIGWLLSHLLLAVIFYGMVLPTGLYLRLRGRDPLRRRLEPDAPTYWIDRPAERPPASYLRLY